MEENNKRIVKNTSLLYFRMLFTMLVSLYTSRVILETLGVSDFGVYNVVGGVIGMLSFLNASMSTATSRFLSYELGKGNYKQLTRSFSSSLTIHLIIAFCIVLLAETLGFWFLKNMIIISIDRLDVAYIVYHLSVFITFISIIQAPFVALIMSHEKMAAYAYIEIVNVCLKLLIVFLLMLVLIDKLFFYVLLLACVSLFVFIIYIVYSKINLEGCVFKLSWKHDVIKPMFKFASYDLYGNASVVARSQGVNILLNMFFGTILNAANGIATQVQSVIMSFAGNLLTAIRPQIVKDYAVENYERMINLINKSSLYTFVLLLLFTLPLLVEMKYVLSVWLTEVPSYCVWFCRYTLLFNLFANFSAVAITGIHATGKIKRSSFINGTLYISVIPVAYVGYKLGGSPNVAFIYNVLAAVAGGVLNVWLLSKYVPIFSFRDYMIRVYGKCTVSFFLLLILNYYLIHWLDLSFFRLVITTILSTLTISIWTYTVLMSRKERNILKMKIGEYVRR